MNYHVTGSFTVEERIAIINAITKHLGLTKHAQGCIEHHVRHIGMQMYFKGYKDGLKKHEKIIDIEK